MLLSKREERSTSIDIFEERAGRSTSNECHEGSLNVCILQIMADSDKPSENPICYDTVGASSLAPKIL